MSSKIQKLKKFLLPVACLTLVFASSNMSMAFAGPTGNTTTSTSTGCIQTKSSSGLSQKCSNQCVSSNPMGWFLCKIYDGMGNFADWIYNHVLQQLLKVNPVDLNPADQTYQIWSTFRIYGNIFLVIALLVVVFGESIGGGLIDAYTAKKVLPRLLTAAVLINLSIYIVAVLVDVMNVVGGGIGTLIVPHGGASTTPFHFTLSGAQTGEIGGSVAIFTVLLVKIFSSGLASGAVYLALIVGGAILFAFLALLITMLIRQAGILMLVVLSPIAFALYCLPNTEQYFKKWWDLLLELLMVYPIVSLFLGAADLLAITMNSGNKNSANPVTALIAFCLQFLPLLAVPLAFKMASSTLGKMHGALNGIAMKGHQNFTKRLAQKSKDNAQNRFLQERSRKYSSYKEKANQSSGIRRRAYGALANRWGGYDIEHQMSQQRAKYSKEADETIGNGDDTEYRALTVDKATSEKRVGDNGTEYLTAGGKWVKEIDVDQSQRRWKGNHAVMQKALAYEMSKAVTQQDMDRVVTSYPALAKSWGMTEGEAQGTWLGAAFANQNTNRGFKYYKTSEGLSSMKLNGKGLITEIDEKQGSYQMLQQSADTWTSMAQEVQKSHSESQKLRATQATRTLSEQETKQLSDHQEVLQRAARIAYATKSSYPDNAGAMAAAAGSGGEATAIAPSAMPSGSTTSRAYGAGASGHTQEAINQFLAITDSLAGGYLPPAQVSPSSHYPPPAADADLEHRRANGREE